MWYNKSWFGIGPFHKREEIEMKTFNELSNSEKLALCDATINGIEIEAYLPISGKWTPQPRTSGMIMLYPTAIYRIVKK